MTDRTEAIELALRRVAAAGAYPPTPPLATAVRARLESAPAARAARRFAFAPALVAAAIAVAVILGALVFSSGTREAVADFFGLEHFRFFRADDAGAPPPAAGTTIAGTPVALDEARRAVDFPIRLPTVLGDPRDVIVQRFSDRPGVVLLYRLADGRELMLLETRGLLGKTLGGGATFEAVRVGGVAGLWFQGQRLSAYVDERGLVIQESLRATDANTLVWERAEVVFRLEGNLTRDEAIRIAESPAR